MIQDALNPFFGLPDMGDYYYDAPDQEVFYAEMGETVNSLRRDKANSARAFRYYQETPPQAGYDTEKKTFTYDISLGGKGIADNDETVAGIKVDDGDTIAIPMSQISPGDDKSSAYLDYISGWAATHGQDSKADKLTLRFTGMDCKELPHYTKVPADSVDPHKISTKSLSEALNNNNYIVSKYKSWMETRDASDTTKRATISEAYDGTKTKGTFFTYNELHKDDETLSFVDTGDGKYHQCFEPGDGYIYILSKNDTNTYDADTIADAGLARDVVVNAINDADAMRIVVDGTQIVRDGSRIQTLFGADPYSEDAINKGKQILDSLLDTDTIYPKPGFNFFGQDAYGRCISAVYVKINGQWINLNKLVIADTNKTEINKYNPAGDGSSGIDTTSYEYDAKQYADSIYANTEKFDDRQKVQEEIFQFIGDKKS